MQEEENLANCSLAVNEFQKEVKCLSSIHIPFTETSQTAIFYLKNTGKHSCTVFPEMGELNTR